MQGRKSKNQLSREQLYSLIAGFKNIGMATDMIHPMVEATLNYDADFEEVLQAVAYGDLDTVRAMLDDNPRLVLQAGTVVTPGGVTIERTTLLECALGAGDPEIVEVILPCFDQIEGGEEVRRSQLKRFNQNIKDMMNVNYDLTKLFRIIKAASDDDVTQVLDKNFEYDSDLSRALKAFRKAVTPAKIVNGMHYLYYTTLKQALDMLGGKKWKELIKNGNVDKCNLVLRQVIGVLQRTLPARDRFAFANVFENNERTFVLKYNNEHSYPDFSVDDAPGLECLGDDYAILGNKNHSVVNALGRLVIPWAAHDLTARLCWVRFTNHMTTKQNKLIELISPYLEPKMVHHYAMK
jgi:hypothetical protein